MFVWPLDPLQCFLFSDTKHPPTVVPHWQTDGKSFYKTMNHGLYTAVVCRLLHQLCSKKKCSSLIINSIHIFPSSFLIEQRRAVEGLMIKWLNNWILMSIVHFLVSNIEIKDNTVHLEIQYCSWMICQFPFCLFFAALLFLILFTEYHIVYIDWTKVFYIIPHH